MTTFRYDGIGLVQDRVALILYDVELTGKKRDKKIMKGSEQYFDYSLPFSLTDGSR